MSFDQEPEYRYLLYHPESDCIFETYNGSEAMQFIDSGQCTDVTDIPLFEEKFKNEQDEKRQKGPGYEYWSKRPMAGHTPGKKTKKMTHKKERAASDDLTKNDLDADWKDDE